MSLVENIYSKNGKRNLISENMRTREPISMKKTLEGRKKGLIIEYKRRSPSGFSDPLFSGPEDFGTYINEFADAFSVLTEPDYFSGNFIDAAGLQKYGKPLLMKDFIDREEMIETSYNSGFDAVLLIADFIPAGRMEELSNYAESLHMDVLAEFHDFSTVEKIPVGRNVMCGYNRRNLKTLRMEGGENLAINLMAEHGVKVLESGLDRDNFKKLLKIQFDAYLIGTSVLREPEFVKEIKKEGNDNHDE